MDNEKRKEFDDRLDYLREYDERRAEERRKRREQVKAMQDNV